MIELVSKSIRTNYEASSMFSNAYLFTFIIYMLIFISPFLIITID